MKKAIIFIIVLSIIVATLLIALLYYNANVPKQYEVVQSVKWTKVNMDASYRAYTITPLVGNKLTEVELYLCTISTKIWYKTAMSEWGLKANLEDIAVETIDTRRVHPSIISFLSP